MDPLFDRSCRLVGWIHRGKYIFDKRIKWIGFIAKGHAWASLGGTWLGQFDGKNCLDRNGRPLAWHPCQPVRSVSPPMTPMTPSGGWSPLSWAEWLGG